MSDSSITPRYGTIIPPRVFERLDERTLYDVLHLPHMADPCHIHVGTMLNSGYGALNWRTDGIKYNCPAHWLAFIRSRMGGRARFGDRAQFNHRCDVRLCTNDNHIYLGTAHDNNRDWRVRGKSKWDAHAEDLRAQFLIQKELGLIGPTGLERILRGVYDDLARLQTLDLVA